jgi:hypothetical protein
LRAIAKTLLGQRRQLLVFADDQATLVMLNDDAPSAG